MPLLKFIKGLAVALAVICSGSLSATANTVDWPNGGSSDITGILNYYGSNSFDSASLSFTGFTANEITSISGDSYYHTHGKPNVTFTIDLLLNGAWTNVWSKLVNDKADRYFRDIPTPIKFASGTVSGIRIATSRSVGAALHEMRSLRVNFAFNPTPVLQSSASVASVAAVPLPASLPALLAGLGALGWVARRRKRA